MVSGFILVNFIKNIARMKLSKNKILITGATSGISKELTTRFCKLNNQIIAVGRNEIRLTELEQFDKRITTFKCDISLKSELRQLVTFIKKDHQDLNILINNAGVQYNKTLLEEIYTLKNILYSIDIN